MLLSVWSLCFSAVCGLLFPMNTNVLQTPEINPPPFLPPFSASLPPSLPLPHSPFVSPPSLPFNFPSLSSNLLHPISFSTPNALPHFLFPCLTSSSFPPSSVLLHSYLVRLSFSSCVLSPPSFPLLSARPSFLPFTSCYVLHPSLFPVVVTSSQGISPLSSSSLFFPSRSSPTHVSFLLCFLLFSPLKISFFLSPPVISSSCFCSSSFRSALLSSLCPAS